MSKRPTVKEDGGRDNNLVDILTTVLDNYLETSDSSSLEEFVRKGFHNQVLHYWANVIGVREERPKFAAASAAIADLIEALDNPVFAVKGLEFVKMIMDNHISYVVKALSSHDKAVAMGMIKMLTAIVGFQRGYFSTDLLSEFPSAEPHKYPALEPPRGKDAKNRSIREAMIKFLCTWISNASSLTKTDIMVNRRRLRVQWFRHMNTDSCKFLSYQLDMLREHILNDEGVSKTSKRMLFNEWSMGLISQRLYRADGSATVAEEFLLQLGSDAEKGILYPCDAWWVDVLREEKHGLRENVSKAGLHISEEDMRKFKVNVLDYRNSALLMVLKANIKPWENMPCQRIALRFLENAPEIVEQVMKNEHWLSFDPKLTTNWVGLVAFFSKFLQLPIPSIVERRAKDRDCPPVNTIMESVLPTALATNNLTKGLASETPLIRQFTAQILNLVLKKYQQVQQFLNEQPGWETGASQFREEFLTRFVNVQTIFTALNTEKEAGLLRYNLVFLCSQFGDLFPEVLPKATLPASLLENITASGLSIAEFQHTMNLEGKLSMTGLWWKKTASGHSLFSTLLKLCTTDVKTVRQSVAASLTETTLPTMLFQNQLSISTLDVLVNSMDLVRDDPANVDAVLDLIDNCVGRFMTQPFKYLDLISEVCKKQQLDPNSVVISPFITVLAEQVKFVPEDKRHLAKTWLQKIFRDACIAGESWKVMAGLCEQFELDSSLLSASKPLTEKSNKLFWNNESPKELEKRNLTYFDLALALEDKQVLAESSALPETPLDVAALTYRSKSFKKSDVASYGIKLKMAAMVTPTLRNYLASPEFFTDNFDDSLIPFYSHLIKSVYEEVPDIKPDFQTAFSGYISDLLKQDSAYKNVFLQHLAWTFTAGQALEYVKLLMKKKKDISGGLEVLAGVSGGFLSTDELVELEKYVRKQCPQNSNTLEKILLDNSSALEKLDHDKIESILKSCYKVHELLPVVTALAKMPQAQKTLAKYVSKGLKKFEPEHLARLVLLVGVPEDEEEVDYVSKTMTKYLTTSKNLDNVDIFARVLVLCSSTVFSDEAVAIVTALTSAPKTHGYTQNVGKLVAKLGPGEQLTKYLSKGIINLTKHLMETTEPVIYASALEVAKCLDEIAVSKEIDFWTQVSAKSINALLEALVSRWFHDPVCIRLVHSLVSCATKQIEYSKLLQMVLNSDGNVLLLNRTAGDFTSQVLTATIVQQLYLFDRKNSNTSVVNGVLRLYEALNTLPDQILLSVLQSMESSGTYNWTQFVFSWATIGDVRDMRVFNIIGNDIEVTLAAPTILASINNFNPGEKNFQHNVDQWNKLSARQQHDYRVEKTDAVYDSSFLMGVIAQRIRKDGQLDIRALVENHYLGFVIASMSSYSVSTLIYCKSLLEAISYCCDLPENKAPFKGLVKIMVRKCLYLMAEESFERLPCIVAIQMAYIIRGVAAAGSVMYDNIVGIILAGPKIFAGMIPIATRLFTDTNKDFFRKLSWGLVTFINGVKTTEDVRLLLKSNFLEQLMSACASPTVSRHIKESVMKLVWSIQKTGEGSMMLVLRHGGLAWNEVLDGEMAKWSQATAARYGVTFKDRQKLLAWTNQDFPRYLARQKEVV
ncbi:ribosome 60S biogenesis N-terminal-domain-containing protein [Yarrowia lipolytica]|uniref:Ribosome 60S biogenesis N-terminal-domain-containing protein n=1 Tax=Yarrowia lipolytica TaxID=4952 RepID=A0A371C2N9_YARLL|nr:ribosome 60S biogenesis N-terminal-domain-containing protein [Yarrowia lipolytica]RDW34801.1 ribosome 60S biogenesis N-terminal-domain-containing protein [Yarrowia lipolytica]RDW38567.1 ribosome 60S biogenesis N-terminal-domain-containing protein [Yarrowia lipolytica]RDW46632.1 ribosome 60S biogenesis N-terminal-domain-containing protein [Yarrowia lipolytica]RDW53006.1 ribosome 60S biogenesis N-terminal-domain-containing protein [Yarrowia lipolytica]